MRSLLLLLTLFSTNQLLAQKPKSARSRLGTDFVTLKNGVGLRGAVLARGKDGNLLMAVRREWLREIHPDFYKDKTRVQAKVQAANAVLLLARIKAWMKERSEVRDLTFFLKSELKRIEKLMEDPDAAPKIPESQFILLDVSKGQVVRAYVQPRERKRVVLLAWRERLSDPERKSVNDLIQELRKRGVEDLSQPVDLSDRLPPHLQGEREWAARKAIVEYRYHKSIDFQGTGNLLVRTGDEAPNVERLRLILEVLKNQLENELLADLLGKPRPSHNQRHDPLEKAISAAQQEDARAVRITRVRQNVKTKRVTVEIRFLARMPNSAWKTVWKHVESRDASKPRPEVEERIANDPRVKKVVDLVKAVGSQRADDAVKLALRFGAATMEAQQAADGRFFEFRDIYLRRLDGPPLVWSTRD